MVPGFPETCDYGNQVEVVLSIMEEVQQQLSNKLLICNALFCNFATIAQLVVRLTCLQGKVLREPLNRGYCFSDEYLPTMSRSAVRSRLVALLLNARG